MMKNKLIIAAVSLLSLSGCQSWLMEVPVGTSEYKDYYVSGATCLPVVTAPSAVILEPKKTNSGTVSIVSPFTCQEVMGLDAMILGF